MCDIYPVGLEGNCNTTEGFKVLNRIDSRNNDPNGLHTKIKSCICDGESSYNFLTGGPLHKKCASSCDSALHKFYTVNWYNVEDPVITDRGKYVAFQCLANSCPESSKFEGSKCLSYIGGRNPQI